jgi:hypothetical protein
MVVLNVLLPEGSVFWQTQFLTEPRAGSPKTLFEQATLPATVCHEDQRPFVLPSQGRQCYFDRK